MSSRESGPSNNNQRRRAQAVHAHIALGHVLRARRQLRDSGRAAVSHPLAKRRTLAESTVVVKVGDQLSNHAATVDEIPLVAVRGEGLPRASHGTRQHVRTGR